MVAGSIAATSIPQPNGWYAAVPSPGTGPAGRSGGWRCRQENSGGRPATRYATADQRRATPRPYRWMQASVSSGAGFPLFRRKLDGRGCRDADSPRLDDTQPIMNRQGCPSGKGLCSFDHPSSLHGSNQTTGQRAPVVRHRSLQYFTASQQRAHFRRHSNGRPQAAQIRTGFGPRPAVAVFAVACRRRGMGDYHAAPTASVSIGRIVEHPAPRPGESSQHDRHTA